MNGASPTAGANDAPSALLSGSVRLEIVNRALFALEQVGGDPSDLFRKLRLDVSSLDHPSAHISFRAFASLMQAISRQADCAHFGLVVGGDLGLEQLGELGRAMRASDTVGLAIRRLIAVASRERGAIVALEISDDLAVVRFLPYDPDAEAVSILGDTFLSVLTRVLRDLCGPQWAPAEVLIPRRVPARSEPYSSYFRAPVRFDEEVAALVFPADTLMKPLFPVGDVLARSEAPKTGARTGSTSTLKDALRRFIRKELLNDTPGLSDVALQFSMHTRTLNRRLRAEGTHYRCLVDEVRFAIARQLVADTDIPLSQVSAALHFSEPAAFTRAFERWAGLAPSRLRENHKRGLRTVSSH